MNFGKKENIKYTRNYLIDNGILFESEVDKKLNDNEYFKEQFKNAKQSEAEDFADKFLIAKLFSMDTSNEIPFTLNDIKKYIDFRESIPQINHLLIMLFIFAYHFSQEENINTIIEKLNLLKNI